MRLHLKIYGQVQNVGFRISALKQAKSLGLFGLARNEKDGTLFIDVEGEEMSVHKFHGWCLRGPEFAKIDKVVSEVIKTKGNFKDFTIIN